MAQPQWDGGPEAGATSVFLGRYVDPLPLRSRPAFQLLSARRLDGSRCVVVVPGRATDAQRAATIFAEVDRAHALIDHPRVPRVTARGDDQGMPFLELGCDAVVDAVELLRLIADAELLVPYAAADGFIVGLREALEAAHRALDPRTGAPLCLGRLSLGNVLVNEAGACFLVGFGRNFPIEKDSGAVDGTSTHFQAPELAVGAPPSPMGDYVALLQLSRSCLPHIGLPPRIQALFGPERRMSDLPLIEAIQWVDRRVLHAHPSTRPTVAEAVQAANRLRALLGVKSDRGAFEALASSLVQRSEEPLSADGQLAPAARTLTLGPEACWAAGPDGARCRLNGPLRRLLLALVTHHASHPGEALTLWDLVDAGWPGERPLASAGANRVYVTLARLRRLGLREIIERFDAGYRLAPTVTVVHRTHLQSLTRGEMLDVAPTLLANVRLIAHETNYARLAPRIDLAHRRRLRQPGRHGAPQGGHRWRRDGREDL